MAPEESTSSLEKRVFCPVAVRVRKQLRIRARYLFAVRKGRERGKGGALGDL